MIRVRDNTPEVIRLFERAGAASLESIGGMMAAYARTAVPVDTGRLRDSVGYSVNGNTLSVGTEVPYALFVEVGVFGHPGVHYLRNAAAMHTGEYAAIMAAAFGGESDMKGGENDENTKSSEESGGESEG